MIDGGEDLVESGILWVSHTWSTVLTLGKIAAVASIVAAFALQLARWFRARRHPQLIIGPFGVGTRLVDSELGTVMDDQLRAQLQRLDEDRRGPRIDVAAPASGELTLDATVIPVPQLGGWLGQALALVGILLPLRQLTVTGCLNPPDAHTGVGISLGISDPHGKCNSSTTITETPYIGEKWPSGPLEARYQRLVLPAAIWVFFTVWDALHTRDRHEARWNRAFGVENWESYALFSVGSVIQQRGQNALARRLFERALAMEPSNRAAALNLAVLDLRDSVIKQNTELRDLASSRLTRITQRDPRTLAAPVHDGLWYRAQYNLAIAALTDPADQQPHSQGLRMAQTRMAVLLDRIHAVRAEAYRPPPFSRDPSPEVMLPFFRAIEPSALIISAGILLRLTQRSELDPGFERALLVAVDNRRGVALPSPANPRPSPPSMATYIVNRVLEENSELRPRQRYNLACFYAQRGAVSSDPADCRRAVTELSVALRGSTADLCAWARHDPSLNPLREDPMTERRVLEAIRRA